MRIVIDMQGAQTESRFRGIGRYTLSFVQAVARNRGEHEIFLALSGLFPDTVEPIRAEFDHLLPQENIRVWYAPGPVREEYSGNEWRRDVAEHIREAFLASLRPDVIHITSLFEGYVDDAVTSIGRFDTGTPVSVSLYDLIPLLNPDNYLKPNPQYEQYYLRKIEHLRKAAAYLAISEFSRQEAKACLEIPDYRVINISTAIEPRFEPQCIKKDVAVALLQRFGLNRPFVLYTGGADERKNLPRLIKAFAALPAPIRENHQLLLAGKMPEGNISVLNRQATIAGLKPGELRFTGYVSDEELVQLYNLCQLFVFPSWHEGFGLPALEAMACGAPVIGANTSSLPEVIGLEAALFDPLDVAAIADKMILALGNAVFRDRLREHGLQQAKKFSWNEPAKRALRVWEALHDNHGSRCNNEIYLPSSDRLIKRLSLHASKVDSSNLMMLAGHIAQNQNTGIERQLILDISELVQSDAATGVQRVVRSYLKTLLSSPPADFRVEPVYATRERGYRYARRFTRSFLGEDPESVTDELLRWRRGDIFFGLDMQHHVQLAHKAFYQQLRWDGVTVKFLVHDLLPIQLPGFFRNSDIEVMHKQWLTMISRTDGAICVSKATADAFESWIETEGIRRTPGFQMAWVHNGGDIESSNPSLGIPPEAHAQLSVLGSRPTFLSVATLEPRKGLQQVIDAFQQLWKDGLDVNLILIGRQGWNVRSLVESVRNSPELGKRLFWLEGISDEYLEQVYSASVCLIAASLNEGFGLPLIEAARYHTPIIARDIPVFREIAGDCAFYFSGNEPHHLAAALSKWLSLYHDGRRYPKSEQLRWSTWSESAEKLKAALIQQHYPCRQLLIDISELIQRDAKSGIQRVVRNILKECLENPPKGYRVEPIYAGLDRGYRYARRFTQTLLDCPSDVEQDEPIDFAPGDLFLGLDFQPQVVQAQRDFYRKLRGHGISVKFIIYDLLCIRMPQYFPRGAAEGFTRWLEVVAESDGALCISRAVADEFAGWVKEKGLTRLRPPAIDWFHLGANIDDSAPTKGFPAGSDKVLQHLRGGISFLMVGTLEPRKGHAQVLEAFEQLWQSGHEATLVIVGKQGWMVEDLIHRLRIHPELEKRLFWLEAISDEYLEKVYSACTCLIAASFGEGFGLPLIEAAQHQLAIIARDIPVFREVAGEGATYFDAKDAAGLAENLKTWLRLYEEHQVPNSKAIQSLTWKQSTAKLLGIAFASNFQN